MELESDRLKGLNRFNLDANIITTMMISVIFIGSYRIVAALQIVATPCFFCKQFAAQLLLSLVVHQTVDEAAAVLSAVNWEIAL